MPAQLGPCFHRGFVSSYLAYQLALAKNRLVKQPKFATMFTWPMALVDYAGDG